MIIRGAIDDNNGGHLMIIFDGGQLMIVQGC